MQWILLGIVALLLLTYFLRKRLLVSLAMIVHFVFVASLFLSLIGIFFQAPFTRVAAYTLENNGTLETLRKVDGTLSLNAIKDAGTSLWDSINDLFGNDNNKAQPNSQKTQGVLEKDVYPALVQSLAGIYRAIAVVVGISLMGLSIYISFTTAGSSEVQQLEARIAALEQQLSNAKNQ